MVKVAHAVMYPSQAVHYVGIIGRERARPLDQFQCLYQTSVMLYKAVSEGIISVRMIGLQLN